MSKRRTSVVWNITHDKLQELLDNSDTLTEVCYLIGINIKNGSVKTLYQRFQEEDFDFTKFKSNRKSFLSRRKKSTLEWTTNSTSCRSSIKRTLIKEKIIPYKCEKCNNMGDWLGESISLQLEHKNGINNDNRLENLCFLCPNCHSQTSTYAGKNSKNTIANICFVDKNVKTLQKNEERKFAKRIRKFNIEKDELELLIKNNTPFTTIGKMLGVSDNAIRKRCKLLGIIIPKRQKIRIK